jgi:hypothetical protein
VRLTTALPGIKTLPLALGFEFFVARRKNFSPAGRYSPQLFASWQLFAQLSARWQLRQIQEMRAIQVQS